MNRAINGDARAAQGIVRCPGWRWLPGMLPIGFDRIYQIDDEGWANMCSATGRKYERLACDDSLGVPDFEDPATIGCLLQLVRDAWGDWSVCAIPHPADPLWVVFRLDGTGGLEHIGSGTTEAGALAAALEAAGGGNGQ